MNNNNGSVVSDSRVPTSIQNNKNLLRQNGPRSAPFFKAYLPKPNQPNHFYSTNCTKWTNNKVTTAPSTSYRGHLLYQLKTNLSSIWMLTLPAHPSNNPPYPHYPKPNQLINPTQFCFSPHPKKIQLIYFKIFCAP